MPRPRRRAALIAVFVLLAATALSTLSACGESDPYAGTWKGTAADGSQVGYTIAQEGDGYTMTPVANGAATYTGQVVDGVLVVDVAHVEIEFEPKGDKLIMSVPESDGASLELSRE